VLQKKFKPINLAYIRGGHPILGHFYFFVLWLQVLHLVNKFPHALWLASSKYAILSAISSALFILEGKKT
jgi:hypothetical protein